MSEDLLLIARANGVATLTLNRPASLNALNRALRARLAASFAELAADGETRVVILTGAGRAFCAGADLKELGSGTARVGTPRDPAYDPTSAMAQFPGPIIGAVNGAAVTGGFELALGCDLLIASPAARFADTHGRVGVHPAWGLSQRLPRLIGLARAKELSLTGNFVDALTAERWGLVNRVVPAEDLMATCQALAQDMLSLDPVMLISYKRLLDDGHALPFGPAMTLEAEVAMSHNQQVAPADIEARRRAVLARGRAQTGA
ncbi:MAG: enoyl-CoA hydratase [Gammaproteobacteria bacterium]|nr:enoyl-CoA hydratase [Gammaproteobacteria bacterium]